MSSTAQAHPICSKCGRQHELDVLSAVNVARTPSLKAKVVSGELFKWVCPDCGTVNLIKYPFLYHDPAGSLIIVLTDAQVSADSLPEGYTGRLVRSVGELVEKVKIFDAGLDDIVIELCKFVTLREIGTSAPLKFFSLDGADSEITFTYPKDGSMEMIAVGLNVYEDCRGILMRNPVLKEKAAGLVAVDSAWLEQFMG